MLKKGITVSNKKGVHFIVEDGGSLLKFKPWLGDAFSFLYDFIMEKSIFPQKFGGDMNRHYEILGKELLGVHEKRVLELATGSGSAVNFLPNDNHYTGTDISPGLLRKAVKNFRTAGFKDAEFYVTSADDLPFDDDSFDLVLCILSLNFFNDIHRFLQEVKRVAVPTALLICSVPVPERNKVHSTIRGTLYSEEEFRKICEGHGLTYETIPSENGALLYFIATAQR
ncbi:MAG: class I SAM-dependent methyltransferase [Deltaproteobacteria bacterium]|nr:class I SAM-dependent methyltransferase [Deltaproteobacteria bacterium]